MPASSIVDDHKIDYSVIAMGAISCTIYWFPLKEMPFTKRNTHTFTSIVRVDETQGCATKNRWSIQK